MMSIESLDSKIVHQVEYYFGDFNLIKDRFIQDKIKEDSEGWMPFDDLMKFRNLSQLSDDAAVVRAALEKVASASADTTVFEVSDKGIRRNPKLPLPKSMRELTELHKDNTVYVKGFDTDARISDIIEYLEKYGGRTLNVFLRRFPKDRKFKGSVLATFKDIATGQAFLDNKEADTYNDKPMIRKWQRDYEKQKQEEREEYKKNQKEKKESNNTPNIDNIDVEGRMTVGALLKLSGDISAIMGKKTDSASNGGPEEGDQEENGRDHAEPDETEEAETEEHEVDNSAKQERDFVTQFKRWLPNRFQNDAKFEVSWVEVHTADNYVIVRFKNKDDAAAVWLNMTGKKLSGSAEESEKGGDVETGGSILYNAVPLSGSLVTGEEEKDFWRRLMNRKNTRFNSSAGGGGFKRGRDGGNNNWKKRGGGGGGPRKRGRFNN